MEHSQLQAVLSNLPILRYLVRRLSRGVSHQVLPVAEVVPQVAVEVAPQPTVLPEVAAVTAMVEGLKTIPTFHSYFVPVIFLGVAFNVMTSHPLVNKKPCTVDAEFGLATYGFQFAAYMMLVFSNYVVGEVQSYLTTHKEKDSNLALRRIAKSKVLRSFVLVSLVASIIGGVFVVLSLVYTFQIKAGLLKCQTTKIKVLIGLVCTIFGFMFLGKGYTVVYSFTYREGSKLKKLFLSF